MWLVGKYLIYHILQIKIFPSPSCVLAMMLSRINRESIAFQGRSQDFRKGGGKPISV